MGLVTLPVGAVLFCGVCSCQDSLPQADRGNLIIAYTRDDLVIGDSLCTLGGSDNTETT